MGNPKLKPIFNCAKCRYLKYHKIEAKYTDYGDFGEEPVIFKTKIYYCTKFKLEIKSPRIYTQYCTLGKPFAKKIERKI